MPRRKLVFIGPMSVQPVEHGSITLNQSPSEKPTIDRLPEAGRTNNRREQKRFVLRRLKLRGEIRCKSSENFRSRCLSRVRHAEQSGRWLAANHSNGHSHERAPVRGWLAPGPLLLLERPRLGTHNHGTGEAVQQGCGIVASHGSYVF